jgi:hypothetical protein
MNAHTADPEQQFRQTGVRAAEILLGLGYHVIPTKGKDPYEIRWQTNIYPVFDLEARILNGDNIGVLFGQDLGDGTRMIALDVDFEDPKLAAVVRALLPDASVRIGREPKFLMPLRVRDAEAASRDFRFYKGEGPGAESCAIQVLGRGQKAPAGPKQAVVWGIHPGTQKPYVWRPDWAGRNIYQRRPGDWPLIGDLAGFMTGLGAALEPLGWKLREPGHQSTGDPFEGVLSPRMIADARATLESELAALAGMGPGTLRGTRCYELGLRIGAVIKAGHIDLDRTVGRLREAMPDNDNAWTREFQRGVFEAKGFRQAKIGESENVDWAGAAKAQGFNFEGAFKPSPEDEQKFKAEDADAAKDIYRRPLIAGVCDILHKGCRERDAEKSRRLKEMAQGFMASLLAAGMATHAELSAQWEQSILTLHDKAHTAQAQVEKDAVPGLRPTEAGWALCAAKLMAAGKTAGEAIRAAQMSHKTPDDGDPMGREEEEILRGLGTIGWTTDAQGNADSKAWSDFAFFLALQLNVWPFYDSFVQRTVFRRLVKRAPSREAVDDADLARWSSGAGAAVAGLCSLATDRTKPWGGVNYTPAARDVEMWLGDMAHRRDFNSMSSRMKNWEAWDGVRRLDSWMPRYTGHRLFVDKDYDYVSLLGAYWMAGFVSRAEVPGTKFDLTLALAGLGGSAKTKMLRVIANETARGVSVSAFKESGHLKFDSSSNLNHAAMSMAGKLILEMAEMLDLRGHNTESLKAVLTPVSDEGRGIHGKDSYIQLRQFVNVMCVNGVVKDKSAGAVAAELARAATPEARDDLVRGCVREMDFSFLRDPTGNRRIGVVKMLVYEVDTGGLVEELPQLIAEARARATEFGLCEKAGVRELPMPLSLRAMIGELEGDFMVAGDMKRRLTDELSAIAQQIHGKNEKIDDDWRKWTDFLVVYKDMREAVEARTRAERDDLQTALEQLGFKRHNGTGNQLWFVKGVLVERKTQKLVALRFGGGGINSWQLVDYGAVGRPPNERPFNPA